MNGNATAQPVRDRQIRVFISSTFRDMQAERDHLVKFIFPQLRKLCESRDVTWGEVDLRWGVTDEQAAEGKVLPICLEEIKRCRPYFLGLLGERYGWIPDALPTDLLEREPWLKEHLHGETSVTELEILHGVLRNPQMAGHAYFYFRDPVYVNSIPENARKDFTAENAEDAERLRRLKEQIRKSGLPLHENYPDPKALGELVLADLTKVINDLFPEGSQPDPLDREAMDHEAYAQSRERVYIGRQEYFERLDGHADANDTQPLVILGESGSGKSALLANWIARYRQAHPDALVLQHYIGATPYSADWAAMLRRFMSEFKRRLGIQQDIPDQSDALRSAFLNWLYMAAAKGRVVLVLDALNQLEDRDGAPDLVWLPPVLPENVRLIVSTLPGRPLDEIQKRNWPTLKVELLSTDERRKLIAEYLAQHAKSLNTARVERIASAPPSANPLYLRVLLDELRLVPTHEELEERIGDYLKAESPYALYEKVIARWEQDYGKDDIGKPTKIVGDTLSLLWAARRGLTESELLQALGKDGEPLPRARWSPLFLAMAGALISRSGLFNFAHDFLRSAARETYLPTEEDQEKAHRRLADYFEPKPTSSRRDDELPWQLCEAKSWSRLNGVLSDPEYLRRSFRTKESEVKRFWSQLESHSDYTMVKAYEPIFRTDDRHADLAPAIAALLGNAGHLGESVGLWRSLWSTVREASDLESVQSVMGIVGLALFDSGDIAGALQAYQEQERICLRMRNVLGGLFGLQASLGNQGEVCCHSGELDRALELFRKQEAICRKLGNDDGLQHSLGNQGLVLCTMGKFAEARELLRLQEKICRETGDALHLHVARSALAKVDYACGCFDHALALLKESEVVFRELGNKAHLANNLMFQGLILVKNGDTKGGLAIHEEAEAICTLIGDRSQRIRLLELKGYLLQASWRRAEAIEAYEEEEQLCRKFGEKDNLQKALRNQAAVHMSLGELDRASKLCAETEEVCMEIGNTQGLAEALLHRGQIIQMQGDVPGALDCLGRAEEKFASIGHEYGVATTRVILAQAAQNQGHLSEALSLLREAKSAFKELGNRAGVALALGQEGLILRAQGKLREAMSLHQEQMRIVRELKDEDGIAQSLGNQAVLLKDFGELDEALRLHEEEERISRKLESKDRIQVSLGNQAVIHALRRDFEKALALQREKERICRELGNKHSLATSLGNQANIRYEQGQLADAIRLYLKEERLCRELGNPEKLAASLYNQAVARYGNGQIREALSLAEEAYLLATLNELPLSATIIQFLDHLRYKEQRCSGGSYEPE